MTELSTNGTGVHEASVLGMSWGGSSAERAYILWTLGANVLGGLALKASDGGGCGRFRVRDDDGVGAGPRLHNHFQSFKECNTSSAHSKSSSLVNSTPTLLSWCRVAVVVISSGEGVGPRLMREGVGPCYGTRSWTNLFYHTFTTVNC